MKSAMVCSVAMAVTLVVGSSHVALALEKVPIISLDLARKMKMSRSLLNIAKRSLPILMLSGVSLASKNTV